ncbi:UDP-glucose 4-epimerase GalE [Truepera radiovictrix]|uniref:UDP-glucose 4-epimerase n=1 Tax=Truepera radiovictrix (strain DSM 17093 / CIP 108686 / LMG 22925 / RQ-24) TaxID=649638 RepID=D7CTY4_TRURR|nr:UDP-glucose 4-epimerase GalE [Truepera radiovictrix]ADI15681.1 UDP-glucose 4-epimerase [Truepera radiovictrix DSM 17093]WMT58691.1 UDP-glucose 4-epimerase GalE [Truepera radiovictrix]
MNVLVTGGAGYIGSVTVEALVNRGHRVVVLDNLVTGHRDAVHEAAAFVHGDIQDPEMVGFAVQEHGVEAVLHFAASSLVGESMEQPFKYFGNNSAGSLKLLETLVGHGVKRFVLSSTAALFGTPDALPIPADAPIRPESVYGESKYLIERMLAWLQRTQGLGYTTLRYFNAAGASGRFGEDHRPESHLIPIVLEVARGKRAYIPIFGDDYPTRDGTCVRDYIHVLDLAEAHVLAVEALEPGEAHAYNLGNGTGFSVREVVEVCREVTGHEIPERVLPRRAGDPAALVADSSLLTQELGWRPQHADLREIVASAWRWFQAHPEGYHA